MIKNLKQLERNATPGPWGVTEFGRIVDSARDEFIDLWRVENKFDTQLIVEMRNALPALLAVVEAAKIHIRTIDLSDYGAAAKALRDALTVLEKEEA